MFRAFCPTHGAEVLLSPRSIEAVDNRADGIDIHWRCTCGTTGVLHTGMPAAARGGRPVLA
jgi:hypothetical protein